MDYSSTDPKTTRALFTETLEGEYDDDRPWGAVRALRKRNTLEVFQIAAEFVNPDIRDNEHGDSMFWLNSAPAGPYQNDPTSTTVFALPCSILRIHWSFTRRPWALAHLADDAAISALIEVRSHADSGVRQAVAVGLAGSVRPEAIATLIEIMGDVDDEVRNWATFGLGTESVEYSPQTREALRNRLTDTFEDVRDEAIWGLALRKDPIGVRMLLERLESDSWVNGDKYAAADILGLRYSADTPIPDLCSGLRQIGRFA